MDLRTEIAIQIADIRLTFSVTRRGIVKRRRRIVEDVIIVLVIMKSNLFFRQECVCV